MKKKLIHSTIIQLVNFENDIHCMPQDDWFEHVPDCNCPCNPKPDAKNTEQMQLGLANKNVWVHQCIKYAKEQTH